MRYKPNLNRVLGFKVVAFVATLLLLFFHDYLPQRSLVLFPQPTNNLVALNDHASGGKSDFTWLGENKQEWRCQINKGAAFPHCGLSFQWSRKPYKTIDFSPYTHIEIDMKYSGVGQYIRLYALNEYDVPYEPHPLDSAKYSAASIAISELSNTMSLPLSDFIVADWWITRYEVPRQNMKLDLTKVLGMGIVQPQPAVLGEYEFQLNRLELKGNYFKTEALYFGVILLWAMIIFSDIFVSYIQLRNKADRDSKKLQDLSLRSAQYKEMSETDKLTSLANRQGLEQIVSNLRSLKLLNQYALLALDLDHFKKVNDEHGHAAGDEVLKETSRIIKGCTRSYDIVARWGGEEFVVLFNCLDEKYILPFAEKIRTSIEINEVGLGPAHKVTASIGATKLLKNESFEQAFLRADKALYDAKAKGRNCIIVADTV